MTRTSAARPAVLAALAALSLAPLAAGAVELADGKLHLDGNGEWSFQATDRVPAVYGQGVPGGEWETAMFDLLAVARPTDAISVFAQMGFDKVDVELEWAFLEWRLNDALRIRAGKVKQPLGNYTELRFVGTARPLFDLSTAVYGPNLIAADAYSGVGLTGDVHFGAGWSFQYDLWGGGLTLPTYEPFKLMASRAAALPGDLTEPPAFEEEHVENLFGLRASLTTPSAWTFRVSGFGGNMDSDIDGAVRLWVAGASAWYRGEKLWLSAEGFYSDEVHFEQTLAAYLEAAWFLSQRVQVAARCDVSRTRLPGWRSSDPLLRHASWTAGANYWVLPTAVLKASVDYVEGSRFILDEEWVEAGYEHAALPVASIADPPRRTLRFVVGTQFSF